MCKLNVSLNWVMYWLRIKIINDKCSASLPMWVQVGASNYLFGAVLLTYLGWGVGLLNTLDFFTHLHAPARIGASLAIRLGLWLLMDFFPRAVVYNCKRRDILVSLPARPLKRLPYLQSSLGGSWSDCDRFHAVVWATWDCSACWRSNPLAYLDIPTLCCIIWSSSRLWWWSSYW